MTECSSGINNMLNAHQINEAVSEIDVPNQAEINSLKRLYPGQGVGPAVQCRLIKIFSSGDISTKELPEEYSFLSEL